MKQEQEKTAEAPLDLSRWQVVPLVLMVVGGLGALIGLIVPGLREQFAFSWLLAFMFYLGICLGGLALVLLHHLFDASWSVGLRRVTEQLAYLAPVMLILFVPVALLAGLIYPWMTMDPHASHALEAKQPLLSPLLFYPLSFICLGLWWWLAYLLRYWSLKQDETGAAECTYRMRLHSYWGMFAYAVTVTMGVILWMKSIEYHWFSTMYAVIYFAGSMWVTLATVYVIAMLGRRQGILREVAGRQQFYFLGSLMFAFTVFYAYVHFSQYFVIWNANVPVETFWYVARDEGSWRGVGITLIFGHFFVPFLLILRIDWKLYFPLMIVLGIWAWIMRWTDLSFNIMPQLHEQGFWLHWLDLACMAFMGGLLAKVFLKNYLAHAPFPQKDPRMAEMLGIHLLPDEYAETSMEAPAPSGRKKKK